MTQTVFDVLVLHLWKKEYAGMYHMAPWEWVELAMSDDLDAQTPLDDDFIQTARSCRDHAKKLLALLEDAGLEVTVR